MRLHHPIHTLYCQRSNYFRLGDRVKPARSWYFHYTTHHYLAYIIDSPERPSLWRRLVPSATAAAISLVTASAGLVLGEALWWVTNSLRHNHGSWVGWVLGCTLEAVTASATLYGGSMWAFDAFKRSGNWAYRSIVIYSEDRYNYSTKPGPGMYCLWEAFTSFAALMMTLQELGIYVSRAELASRAYRAAQIVRYHQQNVYADASLPLIFVREAEAQAVTEITKLGDDWRTIIDERKGRYRGHEIHDRTATMQAITQALTVRDGNV